ncbi:hypothetical protein DH09_13915 [Bacillaceae bacterium JMAK1]|nr:hypothetical protein DH09_13915 [Bacillaceae bacterium JMAK1]
MSMLKESQIVSIQELLHLNLRIPEYQRSYKWKVPTANMLLDDILHAFKNHISEYRIGTVILHKDSNNTYNIVDGQQRLTTLTILLNTLSNNKRNFSLLLEEYDYISKHAIQLNNQLFTQKKNDFSENKLDDLIQYIEHNCTIVKVVTDSEQEAFQFFDSQNSRGKALTPHDLLKAYHLREMNVSKEGGLLEIVDHWEGMNQRELASLFADFLYPTMQWIKRRNGLNFDTSNINMFKGIRADTTYRYAKYHLASHIYIEQFNTSPFRHLANVNLYAFQLTQPVIAGKRFFDFVSYYDTLLKDIEKKLTTIFSSEELPMDGTGNTYAKRLFICSLLLTADRFSIDALTRSTVFKLYTWAYSIRLVMQNLTLKTINNYACASDKDKINSHFPLFQRISEMNSADEFNQLILDPVKTVRTEQKSLIPVKSKLKIINPEVVHDDNDSEPSTAVSS